MSMTLIWILCQKLLYLSIVLSRPRCVSSVTTQPLARTEAPSWCAFIGGQLLGSHTLAGVCCCWARGTLPVVALLVIHRDKHLLDRVTGG